MLGHLHKEHKTCDVIQPQLRSNSLSKPNLPNPIPLAGDGVRGPRLLHLRRGHHDGDLLHCPQQAPLQGDRARPRPPRHRRPRPRPWFLHGRQPRRRRSHPRDLLCGVGGVAVHSRLLLHEDRLLRI